MPRAQLELPRGVARTPKEGSDMETLSPDRRIDGDRRPINLVAEHDRICPCAAARREAIAKAAS